MNEENITGMSPLQDVRGKSDRLEERAKPDSLAWLRWEQLQRGLVRGSSQMSPDEIAELTGMTEEAVHMCFSRSLSKVSKSV